MSCYCDRCVKNVNLILEAEKQLKEHEVEDYE
jgi:hypothetical protein